MIKTVVFGSGQMGTMISRLLGKNHAVIAFADNSPKKQGSSFNGCPIVSPQEAIAMDPECFCIGVIDEERSCQMEEQLKELGFDGEIIKAVSLQIFDTRVAMMRLLADQINAAGVEGDIAELGVFKGEFARQINIAFKDRTFHLFDTFEGFDAHDVEVEASNGFSRAEIGDFSDTNESVVLESMPYKDKVVIHKGYFPNTFEGCENMKFAFVSLDPDLYEPTKSGLECFWPRMSKNGVMIIHDYNSIQFSGVKNAVDEFCSANKIDIVPICDLHGSAILFKRTEI